MLNTEIENGFLHTTPSSSLVLSKTTKSILATFEALSKSSFILSGQLLLTKTLDKLSEYR